MGESSPELKLAPPWEVKLSDRVTGRFGYKDARVEVEIVLPFPFSKLKKTITITLTPEETKALAGAAAQAVLWNELPDFQRQRDGAD